MELTQHDIDAQLLAQFAERNKLIVRFYTEAEKNDAGHYVDVEHVEIRIPGNKDEIRRRRVRESDKLSWPRQYEAFKKQQTTPTHGTPLEALPFLSKAQVQEFGMVGLRTAEEVAAIADVDGQRIMGFQQLKRRIQDHLKAAADAKPIDEMRAALNKRDEEIDVLRKALEEQGRRMQALEKKKAG